MTPIPRRQRQWDIYRANLGEGPDCLVLVLSSNETNDILGSQVVACEIIPRRVQALAASPVTIPTRPDETGLPEAATVSVATLASLPRNCLVTLEGRIEPLPLRLAVVRAVEIILGNEPWP